MCLLRQFIFEMRHGMSLSWYEMVKSSRKLITMLRKVDNIINIKSYAHNAIDDYEDDHVDIDYETEINGPTIAFQIETEQYTDTHKITNVISSFAQKRGWDITYNEQESNILYITISPDHLGVRQQRNDMKMYYHITDASNADSIKRSGIKPSKSADPNRTYSPRVYAFRSFEDVKKYKSDAQKYNIQLNPKSKLSDSIVVTIDISKLNRGTKWHWDTQMSELDAVYTFSHIPKNAIIDINSL